jgi:hypothetical protein
VSLFAALAFLGGCGGEVAPAEPDEAAPDAGQAFAGSEAAPESGSEPGSPVDGTATPPAGNTTAAPEFGGDLRLLARREHELPGRAADLLAHDFDGDGLCDLLAAVESPGRLALFRGTPAGLARPRGLQAVGGWPVGPQLWAEESVTTVWLASREDAALEWWRVGSEALESVDRRELPSRPRAIAAAGAPLDDGTAGAVALGDGSLWLVGADRELRAIEGRRERVTRMAFEPGARRLWIASQEPPSLSAVVWNADGAPELQAAVPTNGVPRDLTFSDVDRDGDLELCVVGGVDHLWIFGVGSDDGSIELDAHVRLRTPARLPLRVFAADLDGDGADELLTLQQEGDGYGVLGAWEPVGRGFSRVTSEYAGQKPYDLAAADFDGDGIADLCVSNRDALRLSVLPGTGLSGPGKDVFYQAQRLPVGRSPLSVAAGDLDGDGAPDGAVIHGVDGTVGLLANRFGLLQAPASRPLVNSPSRVIVADFDGDGNQDIAGLGRSDRARLSVQLGDGAGGVKQNYADIDVGQASEMTLASDARGQHLLLCSPAERRLLGWSRGELAFSHALDVPPYGAASRGDWIWFAGGDSSEELYRVDREGRAQALLDLEGRTLRLLAGQATDGGIELWRLARRRPGDPQGWIEVLEVRGDGAARQVARSPIGLKAHDLALGDLDGDGRWDAAVASQNSHQVNLRLRRGDGLIAPGAVPSRPGRQRRPRPDRGQRLLQRRLGDLPAALRERRPGRGSRERPAAADATTGRVRCAREPGGSRARRERQLTRP